MTKAQNCGAGSREGGFTLIELMVTIVVAAILLAIAVPSFQHLMLSTQLGTAANTLVEQINTARLNAVKLNTVTQFCGSTGEANTSDTLGSACGTTAGAVYSLPIAATSATKVRSGPAELGGAIQVTRDGVAAIRFSSIGFGYKPTATPDTPFAGTVAIICTPRMTTGNRREIDMTGGSIITVGDPETGACP